MIEFTLNRNRNGKKSRWAKKYPRKRILKRGSEKAAGWYFHNWYDDGYHYFGGDPEKDVICTKVRDPKTGQLSGFKIENPEVIDKESTKPFVVIDDLCDGGGTFKGVAQLQRHIYVTHMVNPKGITTLSENYKKVYFTK